MRKIWPTKPEAIRTLLNEDRRTRRVKASYSRCWNALMALGLNNVEVNEVLYDMDMCDASGNPYPPSPLHKPPQA